MWAFSKYGEQGLLFNCGAWAFLCSGFSCCRAQALGMRQYLKGLGSVAAVLEFQSMGLVVVAQLLSSMWNPPRPGVKSLSPALKGGFSAAGPPAKP